MTSDDIRCQALAARQQRVYLALRRQKRSLLDGKEYKPALTKPTPQEPLPNVTKLRKRA